jgi:hypothetical protein
MWAVPKIVFDFFRKRRRKQEEALTNQAGKQDQKQGSCLVLEGEILLLARAPRLGFLAELPLNPDRSSILQWLLSGNATEPLC